MRVDERFDYWLSLRGASEQGFITAEEKAGSGLILASSSSTLSSYTVSGTYSHLIIDTTLSLPIPSTETPTIDFIDEEYDEK